MVTSLTIVTNILGGSRPDGTPDTNINIDIKPEFLPVGRYYDSNNGTHSEIGQSGIVAVKKHDGTDADPQVLTVVNGVLDVEIPDIPDAFKYEGNVYFNEAGNPFAEETGDTPFPSSATNSSRRKGS